MVMLSAIQEATAATVLTVAAADELASSCTSSGFGQARGTAGSLLSGEATGELDWEILPSVSVSRELVSAFSTSSLSAAALSVEALCPMPRTCKSLPKEVLREEPVRRTRTQQIYCRHRSC